MSHRNIPLELWSRVTEWSTYTNYPGVGSGRIYTIEHSPFGIQFFLDTQGDLWQVRPVQEGGYKKEPMQGYTLALRECNEKLYMYVIHKDPNMNS